MGKKFVGNTEEAGGKFLNAEFWKKGKRVEGVVTGKFETSSGDAFNIKLAKAEKIDGETTDRVAVGGLKGMLMALRASGANEFEVGDGVIIECTGTTPTDKGSPMINFKVLVDRN